MGKPIKLTEEKLREIVRTTLNEMAYERGEIVDEIRFKTTEIIRNFVLVVYARKHNLLTIEHWRGELLTYITDIQDMDTKPKSGNRKMVREALQEQWVEKMELDTHPDKIIHKYIAKFKTENLHPTEEEHIELTKAFIDNMGRLMDEMAYGNSQTALQFVNSI